MNLIRYISSRFNRHSTLPTSLKVMRVIAICGMAIATATLIVTLAILNGFEREYRRSILDFNAHVVLMKAGEVEDPRRASALIDECRSDDTDRAFIESHGLGIALWKSLYGAYRWTARRHERFFENAPVGSLREALLMRMKPRGILALLPSSVKEWHARMREIDRKDVSGITPFIYREGLLISHGVIKGVIIKGIDPDTIADVNPMRIEMANEYRSLAAALEPRAAMPHVILGARLAEKLGIDPAEQPAPVRLLVPTREIADDKEYFDELLAVGTFESGLYDYDAQFALMSLAGVRSLFAIPEGKLTGIELKLNDPGKAQDISEWLETRLGGAWRVIPWSELNADIFRAVEMEKYTFSIIMGILAVVAAFNIIGVLVLVILMRSHEISLLRALGMTQKQLVRIFTRGGLIIGIIGVPIGTLLGLGLAFALSRFEIIRIAPEIYFLNRLPIDISPLVCGMIALFCLAVCWGTSWTAAKKLAGVPISEGLQKGY